MFHLKREVAHSNVIIQVRERGTLSGTDGGARQVREGGVVAYAEITGDMGIYRQLLLYAGVPQTDGRVLFKTCTMVRIVFQFRVVTFEPTSLSISPR
jgi:hypothetical protein